MQDPEGVYMVSMYAHAFIVAQMIGIAVITLMAIVAARRHFFGTTHRRRAFQCGLAGREVEVELAERRIAGIVAHADVVRCTAFECATAISCARRCADRSVRARWVVSDAAR